MICMCVIHGTAGGLLQSLNLLHSCFCSVHEIFSQLNMPTLTESRGESCKNERLSCHIHEINWSRCTARESLHYLPTIWLSSHARLAAVREGKDGTHCLHVQFSTEHSILLTNSSTIYSCFLPILLLCFAFSIYYYSALLSLYILRNLKGIFSRASRGCALCCWE